MATEAADSPSVPERADSYAPYPASVVDRFLRWIERIPVPAWTFYLALLATLIVFFHGLAWLEGELRVGTFEVYRSSVPVYPVASLALVHYLNRAARRALAAFRPALGASDIGYAQFEYMLVTLPRRGTWVTLSLSLLFTVAYFNFTPYLVVLFRRSPWVAVVESAVYAFAFGMVAVLFYHTIHQLRMVSRIHASATNVNLFRLTPLYAFSGLTAQTGIGLLLMNYFGVLTDPATFENLALFTLTIAASLITVVCFIVPLLGMHARIVAEKKRERAEASNRLEATIRELYARADTRDLEGADQLNNLMASLVVTLEYVEKIPTWPWERGTLLSFVTVFVLPVVVRLIVGFAELLLF
jgi:uncharacterized membrane protein